LTVAALAGRRIDPEEATSVRFPASNILRVQAEIERVLLLDNIDLLVCAAASGADLLALEVAQRLKIKCRVVLPFNAKRFRSTSVVDRSEAWGSLYDSIIAVVEAADDLVVIDRKLSDDEAYKHATNVILAQAKAAANPNKATAIIVWDGKSRGRNDYADQFRRLARTEGMKERVILTR
jgi:hypothetical protein